MEDETELLQKKFVFLYFYVVLSSYKNQGNYSYVIEKHCFGNYALVIISVSSNSSVRIPFSSLISKEKK